MQSQPTTATNPTSLPLDPDSLAVLLQTTLDALPHHPAATPAEIAALRRAAVNAIATARPRDATEAILAARYVASHYASMDCVRCAAQPGLPILLKLRFLGRFHTLSRLMDTTKQALDQAQSRPARQPATLSAPIPAPRPRQASVASTTATANPPAAAAPVPPQPAAAVPAPALPPAAAAPALPQPAASQPTPTPSLLLPNPHPAIAAPAPSGDALGQRMMKDVAARMLTAPITRAA